VYTVESIKQEGPRLLVLPRRSYSGVAQMDPDLEDTMEERKAFVDVIAILRTLNLVYHHAHIQADGPNFAGDHALLQRLYLGEGEDNCCGPILEIDGVMERLQGIYPEHPLAPREVAEGVNATIGKRKFGAGVESYLRFLLGLELRLQERLGEAIRLFEQEVPNPGVANLFQTLADNHQVNLYLLQQRLT